MKKYMKTTLGRKLAAFYLILFLFSFYFMQTLGYQYIYDKVVSETQNNLHSAGTTLLDTHIYQQAYTEDSIRTLRTHLNMASGTAECRIIIISRTGKILVDTSESDSSYNVYQGDTSFLRRSYVEDFSMNGYLKDPSLCISIQLEHNPYLNGYLLLTKKNSSIKTRADYYFNIVATLFYLIMTMLAIAFFCLYFFNFRPLKKLRNGAKDFSIAHDNPPIIIKSNDEYGELAQTLNIIGAELSKFEEYQRKFISNISHDFRSPLTNIRGYVQAMSDGIVPPDEQEKYLNIILSETDRLTTLTTKLLDANRFDRDNIFLNISDFDIQETVRSTADALQGSADKKQITFELVFAQQKPLMVSGDPDKIQQVLYNLMENAIKFSSENSSILIRTRMRGDKIFVAVKDTGIGIPKEETSLIWDRFYKTDISRGKDKLGTGLGLSICKEIINAHKQTIDVVSTVGVGSKFVFTLPKA
ncbi:MAG: HAMP domain-containing histidine kinase [Lachnospiraceae bacterium]|nr:HAMP domain-containing histidine kinase [Lachnospiraceae bacterium]